MESSSSSSPLTTTARKDGPYMHRQPKYLYKANEGFLMGMLCGIPLHLIKGISNSPNGQRLSGGFQAMRTNAPRLACTFAAWSVLQNISICVISNYRQKNDMKNVYVSAGVASGLVNFRKGVVSASKWAILTPFTLISFVTVAEIMLPSIKTKIGNEKSRLSSDTPTKSWYEILLALLFPCQLLDYKLFV
ncbi:Mitochondrial import inner membrane translocase subunit tim17-1 [Thalictrum thalictroides]|uniref:Mitochondrial import inner membrane translocase subunit tim17-1 n=1 Tax=Thalictrum thalictroides TaxID=46969 RepID=A0A7J6V9T6_THATH|nr:Mitochondrial import inner membrane translocase subunit tim17-1 [Thalictrum thalictroides]